MKALVTGASGFIGSTLIEELSTLGFEVHALMRRSSSSANLAGLKYKRVEGDITDEASLRRALKDQGITYVFHLAGLTSAKNREAYFEFNARGTERLARVAAEVAQAEGKPLSHFVYVSSLAAAGPAPSLEAPRTESDEDQPVSAYGESKLEGERALLKYSDVYPVTIVRPPMVYGPKDKGVFVVIRTVARGLMPSIAGRAPGGNKYYSAVHSRDLCRGIVQAAVAKRKGTRSGEVFYLTDDGTYSYQELLSTIAERLEKNDPVRFKIPPAVLKAAAFGLSGIGRLTGRTFPLNLDKLNEILPDYWICSNQKAKNLLGFVPEFDLSSGMANAIDWYKKQRWL